MSACQCMYKVHIAIRMRVCEVNETFACFHLLIHNEFLIFVLLSLYTWLLYFIITITLAITILLIQNVDRWWLRSEVDFCLSLLILADYCIFLSLVSCPFFLGDTFLSRCDNFSIKCSFILLLLRHDCSIKIWYSLCLWMVKKILFHWWYYYVLVFSY